MALGAYRWIPLKVRFYTRDVTLSVARVFMWLGWMCMEECFNSFFFKRSFLWKMPYYGESELF